MFAHLQLSRQSFYDTAAFCDELRDASGERINLTEQKDVNEFAGQVFDQLETETQRFSSAAAGSAAGPASTPSSLSPLLQPFRGVLLNQMLSRECGHGSEREEPFYMLSLTVKNKQSLEAALDLFVQGDLLDGENKCQSASAQRRRAAASPPLTFPSLTLHVPPCAGSDTLPPCALAGRCLSASGSGC